MNKTTVQRYTCSKRLSSFLQTIYVKPPSIFRQKVLAKIKLYTILAKTAKINN